MLELMREKRETLTSTALDVGRMSQSALWKPAPHRPRMNFQM